MVKKRIPETDQGIVGELNVSVYEQMQRRFRDKGWIETDRIIQCGIKKGYALEIGPGPGYLGLEWLKKTEHTFLKGIDISKDMVQVAEKNASAYGFLNSRAEYIVSNASTIPFPDNTFDAVFSNGSLHEWEDPILTFNEIYRVLNLEGIFFVSDLKRNMSFLLKFIMKVMTKPKEIKPYLYSSINASYTKEEIVALLKRSNVKNYKIKKNMIGLEITGVKS